MKLEAHCKCTQATRKPVSLKSFVCEFVPLRLIRYE